MIKLLRFYVQQNCQHEIHKSVLVTSCFLYVKEHLSIEIVLLPNFYKSFLRNKYKYPESFTI